jgi:hypothetical protein
MTILEREHSFKIYSPTAAKRSDKSPRGIKVLVNPGNAFEKSVSSNETAAVSLLPSS